MAASVPYNVAADGPFTISMFSISSGFRSPTRLGLLPPVVPPLPVAVEKLALLLVIRMPSMIQMGSLDKLTEFMPRMRMRAPVPVCVPLVTVTPGAREFNRSLRLPTGAASRTLDTSMFVVALPISTRRCSPVAVVTTGARFTAATESDTSSVTVSPDTIVIFRACSPYPTRSTRAVNSPAGSGRRVSRPSRDVVPPMVVPTRNTRAASIGFWPAASSTRTDNVPPELCWAKAYRAGASSAEPSELASARMGRQERNMSISPRRGARGQLAYNMERLGPVRSSSNTATGASRPAT